MRSAICLVLLLAACGGGSGPVTPPPPPPPPPPPGPAPVATVTMSRDTATLVPQQTLQLSAATKDAGGSVLTGRSIAWSSSLTAAASVSADGLVTAVAAGASSIAATSEGKTGSTAVTVKDGAVLTAAGGFAEAAGAAARVTVPAGALSATQAITLAPVANPLPHPRLVPGTAWDFGPTLTFNAPVTLRISYAAATLPAGTDQTRLRIHRLTGVTWTEVAGSTVDPAGKTVSAPTSSFSTYAVIELTPVPVATVTVSRDTATLVPTQSLQLDAVLKDQGGTVLTGRSVTWNSSAQGVATVSATGLVTAVTTGTATITAASEGQSGVATITVRDGAVVGATGGVATTVNGVARVSVPAGALASAQAITIAPAVNPPGSSLLVPGTAFDFGPSGTFALPLTMTISYAGSTVPAAVDPATLKIHRLTAGAWVALPGSTVDQNARTVTAQTSSFSTYAVLGGAAVQQVVITFDYSIGGQCSVQGTCGLGQLMSWTVPNDVFTATFELWGASGGGVGGIGTGRGKGGKTTATIAVYPGEVMQIRLGQAGGGITANRNGGAGGGGAGAGLGNDPSNGTNYCPTLTTCFFGNGHGGGGETDVRRGSPISFDVPGWPERVLVAGGGGGDGGPVAVGGPLTPGGEGTVGVIVPGAPGGFGGGPVGGAGSPGVGNAFETSPIGGTGGSQLAGGIGGLGSFNFIRGWQSQKAEDGTAMWGGGRGSGDTGSGGGGGGGGWFGGGGGGATSHNRGGATGAGGGGGSSHGPPGSVFIQGVHTGHGKAILTYTPSPGLLGTAVTVTSSHNPATTTQQIVYTATVSLKPPATGTVTGTVQFEVDGVAVGAPVTLVNGQASSSTVTGLVPGAHSVRAIFLGTSTHAPSAGNLSQTVQ